VGSWAIFGGACDIACFTDVDPSAAVERIRAVVVQRRPARSPTRASLWRRALRILSRRARRDAPIAPALSRRGLWTGSVGNPGSAQVLYSRERAVVAVRGREFPLPADGRTLLVLVEERGVPSQTLIQTHVVSAPAVDRAPLEAAASEDANRERLRAQMHRARLTWHRWLDEEPLIREFISDAPSDGPA
jgi:hypothetical protein